MRDCHSSEYDNKRLDDASKKDALLERISLEILVRGLRTPDLRLIDPTITAAAVSGIRHRDRSAASVDRLTRIAAGLGLLDSCSTMEKAA